MTSSANLTVPSLFDFRHHVVLVTGGATGLGEMAAQAFVQNGARVFIASRKESELKKTSSRINSIGPGTCEYIVADLKDREGVEAMCREVKKRTDRLTVLLNNSGATWGGAYTDFPESGWDKIMALNVKSMFYTVVGLEDLLLKGTNNQNPSHVINVASVAGLATGDPTSGEKGGLAAPGTGTYSYGPSKAACIHLSKIQASKLAPKNIMVNCICPGVFPSRMTSYGVDKFMDTLVMGQPTGRIGQASDFAGLVLFLSSRASAHITGNVIAVDGGSLTSGFRRNRTGAAKI